MSVTPKMDSSVPCNGREQTIYPRNQAINATVFIRYKSTRCTFTARLYTLGPGGAKNLEVELVIPAGGGYRAIGGSFHEFAVQCDPAVNPTQEQAPEAQASYREEQKPRQVSRQPGDEEECEFEWYVVF